MIPEKINRFFASSRLIDLLLISYNRYYSFIHRHFLVKLSFWLSSQGFFDGLKQRMQRFTSNTSLIMNFQLVR